ncbi:MAG: glycosyltransferase family 39 protein [Candidatus Aenigmarchaeota archaeon]|nr:glycosyltransferase family 39 protein [Candidatus Aenigmarchaeota archaeon]
MIQFKRYIVPIVVVILFMTAIYLRLYSLEQPFEPVQGWNAGHYMVIAKNFDSYGWLNPVSYENILHFSVPPFYSWIMKISISFSKSELFARFPSVIFGLLSIAIIYIIGKELYNKKFALLSSLIFALVPMHLLMSKKVLVDISMLFFMILSLYFFIRFYKKNTHMDLILSSFFLGLAILTKQPSAGLIFIYLFIIFKHKKEQLKTSITIILTLSLLPFILLSISQPGFLSSIKTEGSRIFIFPNQTAEIAVYGLSPLIAIFSFIGLYHALKQIDWRTEIITLWFIIYFIFFAVKMPSGHMHYLIPVIPATVFLSVIFMEKLMKSFRIVILIILFASIIFTDIIVLKAMYSYDNRFVELRNFMMPRLNRDSKIFLISDGGAAPLVAYYMNRTVRNIYPGRSDPPSFVINHAMPIDYYHFDGASNETLNKISSGYLITSPSGMPENMKIWLSTKKLLKRIEAKPIDIWVMSVQPQSIEIYEV